MAYFTIRHWVQECKRSLARHQAQQSIQIQTDRSFPSNFSIKNVFLYSGILKKPWGTKPLYINKKNRGKFGMIKFLYVVGLAFFLPSLFIFLVMNLNKTTCSVTPTEAPKKGVKKESQRIHTDLTDKFHLGNHFKHHWTKRDCTLAVPVPWKGIFSPEGNVSAHLPAHMYPHPLSAPLYTCKDSKCNLPQKRPCNSLQRHESH